MLAEVLTNREVTPPPFPIRKFTVTDYHRLTEVGFLGDDDRVELLEGWIVPKVTHHPPHDATIQILAERLAESLPPGWKCRIQSAITTQDSEPELDVAVVRGNARTYLERHPQSSDIGLIVEVAESTVEKDCRDKARIYARAGIAQYWVINLVDHCVEVFREPSGLPDSPGFQSQTRRMAGQMVPLFLNGTLIAEIAASDLLP